MATAPKPIIVKEFPGMNNVARQGVMGTTSDGKQNLAAVKAVLNMNTTTDRKLEKRAGYALWRSLPGAHSLWFDGKDFLCAARGTASLESLYRVSMDKLVTEICPITGLGEPLYYLPASGVVYISSRMWNGVYASGAVRHWGSEYGDDPALLDDAGSSEKMMLLNTSGPPCMENLCLAGGRIFGSVGSRVHYSDPPMALEMYRPDTYHDFSDTITMIAVADDGMFFASADQTWFATGHDPLAWEFTLVGKGAIPGSLQYKPQQHANNIPMWLNKQGVQIGTRGVLQATEEKVRFDTAGRAASVFKKQGGGQYLSSFIQPPDVGFGDSATCEIVRNGKLLN